MSKENVYVYGLGEAFWSQFRVLQGGIYENKNVVYQEKITLIIFSWVYVFA